MNLADMKKLFIDDIEYNTKQFEINFVVISNEFSIPFQLKLLRV